MKVIGLTGGIGSGKSTVGEILSSYGVPIYNSDLRARDIMNKSETIIGKLKEWYGENIYTKGVLDRKRLGAEVFANPPQLERLNQLIHPIVYNDFAAWKEQQNGPMVVKEAAILFESGAYVQCDYIVTVSAPESLRIQRVIDRDHTTKPFVLDRLNKQWTDAEREAKSDYILYNESTLEDLKSQVATLYSHLKSVFFKH